MLRKLLPIALLAAAIFMPATAAVADTNDPAFGQLWGVLKIKADKAWATSAGNGVVVGIVDTGVDFTHPDLENKKHSSWSCYTGECRAYKDNADSVGHGTHVAGTVAAETGNGIGVASVAPGARIMSVQVCTSISPNDPCVQKIPAGIRWAADQGAQVINMSLGLPAGTAGAAWGDAIQYAWNKGAVVVASAGNDSMEVSGYTATENLLVVGATGPQDERAYYSSGTEADVDVDVWAPGGNPTDGRCDESDCVLSTYLKQGYANLAGTSMAAPHVTGVAALLRCQGHSNGETVSIIKSTADNTSAGRRVNALKAVSAARGGNCGATYPIDQQAPPVSGGTRATFKPTVRPPSGQAGSAGSQQPGQPAAGEGASHPTNPLGDYVDPEPSPIASDKKGGISGKTLLNIGIASVLVAAGVGWYLWTRSRRVPVEDE